MQKKHRWLDVIAIVLSLVAMVLLWLATKDSAIIISLAAILIAYLTAKYYGDAAAGRAAREYAEKQAEAARIIALRSLLNEIKRARQFARQNLDRHVAIHVDLARQIDGRHAAPPQLPQDLILPDLAADQVIPGSAPTCRFAHNPSRPTGPVPFHLQW